MPGLLGPLETLAVSFCIGRLSREPQRRVLEVPEASIFGVGGREFFRRCALTLLNDD